MTTFAFLSTLLLSATGVLAASPAPKSYTAAANALCKQLHSKIPARVAYSSTFNTTEFGNLTEAYAEATQRYNNIANREDVPACVLFPDSAADVSVAMKLLSKAPSVPFALKSGGHDWNRGFSSTDGGVLITFRPFLNYTVLSKDKTTAEIGPGARWGEVLNYLDKHNRVAVGGRDGDVGVGGYLPRGGISFLSPEYGFGSDNVVDFEVVLANGTIVNANKTSHPDLFWALRGGGSLFGAVTKYTVYAHPIDNVWGGVRVYSFDKTPAILSAVSKFTANFNDTKAALTPTLVTFGPDLGNITTWQLSFFYNGVQPPAHIFADFDAIESISGTANSPSTKRYPKVVGTSGGQPANRTAGAFNSLPNLPPAQMAPFLETVIQRLQNASFFVSKDVGFQFCNIAFQPIPVALQQSNFQRGPAALSTNPAGGDKLWLEYTMGWADSRCDFTCMRQLRAVTEGVEVSMQDTYPGVKPTNFKKGDLTEAPYNPVFFNDAMWDQNVYKSYGDESYARLRQLRLSYDPHGVFLSQTSQFTF